MQITIRRAGGASVKVDLDGGQIEAGQLRRRAAAAVGLEGDATLIHRGKRLPAEGTVEVEDGDTVMAVKAPRAPVVPVRDDGVGADDDLDDELRFTSEGLSPFGKWMARILKDKVGLPEPVLVLWADVSPKSWALLAFIFGGSPLASWYGWGPPFLIVSMILFMFVHLGKRKEGESSAYSVFNEGFRELPGQLNAQDMDHAIRHGQM